MIRCDLLCPFARALDDFPYSVHLKGECLNIELRCRASRISRGSLGSAPSGRYVRGRGWILLSATVNPGAKLPFYTRVLSQYLPTRRARSGRVSAVQWASCMSLQVGNLLRYL